MSKEIPTLEFNDVIKYDPWEGREIELKQHFKDVEDVWSIEYQRRFNYMSFTVGKDNVKVFDNVKRDWITTKESLKRFRDE